MSFHLYGGLYGIFQNFTNPEFSGLGFYCRNRDHKNTLNVTSFKFLEKPKQIYCMECHNEVCSQEVANIIAHMCHIVRYDHSMFIYHMRQTMRNIGFLEVTLSDINPDMFEYRIPGNTYIFDKNPSSLADISDTVFVKIIKIEDEDLFDDQKKLLLGHRVFVPHASKKTKTKFEDFSTVISSRVDAIMENTQIKFAPFPLKKFTWVA